MKDGQQIRFTGEGDQEPDLEPGDIVIVLDEKEHDTFQRSGMDLAMRIEINLAQALCGFQKTVPTLDKRVLVITSYPGQHFTSSFSLSVWLKGILQLCPISGWHMIPNISS